MRIFSLFKNRYRPLNIIEISKKNLLKNYQYLTTVRKGQKIAPVLKSNAYGHGIVEVAIALDTVGAPFFCVDSLHEAYQLLKAKIMTPILIMGYIEPANLQVKKLPFSYVVYSVEMLEAIRKYQPHAGIHIFVDTGMHREGVPLEDLEVFAKKAKKYGLKIEGLMSHFAMADKPHDKNTQQQVKNFTEAQKIFRSLHIFPKYVHIVATSGVLHGREFGNVARVGIGMYGIDPEGKNNYLKPVIRVTSTIAQVKQVKEGEKIGYDFTFTAKKDMKIAILPIGYNDGVNRKLSNKGFMQVVKVYCPIIGRVNMNITILDVSRVSQVKVGDSVVVYSNNPMDKNSIIHAAKICRVIPYEILVGLHTSTKRVIV